MGAHNSTASSLIVMMSKMVMIIMVMIMMVMSNEHDGDHDDDEHDGDDQMNCSATALTCPQSDQNI